MKLKAFNEDDATALLRLIGERRRRPDGTEYSSSATDGVRVQSRIVVGKVGSAIAARSGATVSSGTLTVWALDPGAGEIAATSDTVDAWNLSEVSVPSDTDNIVIAERDMVSGEWILISEMCSG